MPKTNDAPDDRGLTWSPLLHIETRAADKMGAMGDAAAKGDAKKLLDLCCARAADPSIFDTYPPYTFSAEISSNRLDSYHTRMMPSTLKNYAAETAAGVAFLRNHNTADDPVGHSLTGTYTAPGGNGVAKVRADFYLLTDPGTEGYVNKIRSGVVKSVSVGFYDGQWICSLCGRDMMDYFSADGCPHMLGMSYADEGGKGKSEPQVARASIENAHLAEVSGVYAGSTPGAMIDKARALNDAGLLDHRLHDLVQVRYQIRLPGGERSYAGVTRPGVQEAAIVEPEERIKDLEAKLAAALATSTTREQTLADIRRVATGVPLPDGHAAIGDPAATLRFLAEERARLAPLADEGRAYRADLIAAALAEGTRAQGADFARETYQQVLENAPLATVKRMRDDWAALGNKQFPGGRVSTDGAGPAVLPSTEPLIPASAYRSGR